MALSSMTISVALARPRSGHRACRVQARAYWSAGTPVESAYLIAAGYPAARAARSFPSRSESSATARRRIASAVGFFTFGYPCISQALWKAVSAASRVSANPEFGARAPISVQYHNSLSVLCMR